MNSGLSLYFADPVFVAGRAGCGLKDVDLLANCLVFFVVSSR